MDGEIAAASEGMLTTMKVGKGRTTLRRGKEKAMKYGHESSTEQKIEMCYCRRYHAISR
jgi:hypothetical protein